MIQAGGETLLSEILSSFILFGIRMNCLISGRSLLLYQFTKTGIKLTAVKYCGISLLSTSYKMLSNILLSRLSTYVDEIIGDYLCGFRCNRSATDQIFCIGQKLEKKMEYNETVHQLFTDFKKVYDSVISGVLYNILKEYGVSIKLVGLIRMCLNETDNKVRVCKYLSENFPIQNSLKQGDALSPLLFNFA
jgi:hypothetical protein